MSLLIRTYMRARDVPLTIQLTTGVSPFANKNKISNNNNNIHLTYVR